MSDLEPITRKEQYLNRLTGEEQAIPDEPITRTEQYLARLCGVETEIPSSPITREETYLAYLNGENVTLPEPITRLEQFMAFAASKSETKPTPLTREEFYWDKYQGGSVLKDFPGLPASIVTVTDALAKPLDSLKVAITPVQEGSGDPSPDNIRPISGWTGANVTRAGKNLLNYNAIKQITYNAQSNQRWGWEFNAPKTYTIRVTPQSTYVFAKKVSADGTYDEAIYVSIPTKEPITRNPYTVTISEGEKLIIYSAVDASQSKDIAIRSFNLSRPQLEVGSVATLYEPYTGQDYTITFPSEAGTVYGGTLDVVNGVLTVDRTMVDMGSLTYTIFRNTPKTYSAKGAKNFNKASNTKLICSIYKQLSAGSYSAHDDDASMWISNGTTNQLYMVDNRFNDATEIKEGLSGIQLVYELATPITYQLTPTEVQMLLGTNNIWADTGDILEGKYWSKNPVTVTQAMLSTLRSAGEITEITPTEEPEELEETEELKRPEENDER